MAIVCRRLSFSVRPENETKDALKRTYGSLDNHSLLPTHSQYHPRKRLFHPLLLSTQTEASIAYGNISDTILSLIILHVYFSILICTAHSQTNLV